MMVKNYKNIKESIAMLEHFKVGEQLKIVKVLDKEHNGTIKVGDIMEVYGGDQTIDTESEYPTLSACHAVNAQFEALLWYEEFIRYNGDDSENV